MPNVIPYINFVGKAQPAMDFYEKLIMGDKSEFTPMDSGWGAIIAHCKDQFGIVWMLNYDKPSS